MASNIEGASDEFQKQVLAFIGHSEGGIDINRAMRTLCKDNAPEDVVGTIRFLLDSGRIALDDELHLVHRSPSKVA